MACCLYSWCISWLCETAHFAASVYLRAAAVLTGEGVPTVIFLGDVVYFVWHFVSIVTSGN